MRYCPIHERGYIPAGYDTRHRQGVPARWHPLSKATIRWALGWATIGHCRGQITLEETRCDWCPPGAMPESPPPRQRNATPLRCEHQALCQSFSPREVVGENGDMRGQCRGSA